MILQNIRPRIGFFVQSDHYFWWYVKRYLSFSRWRWLMNFTRIPPPYFLEWFEMYHPNVPLNLDDGTFCLQCMNVNQGTKKSGRQWNIILDLVVTMINYKKTTIDHSIYIKVFNYGTVFYPTVSTGDVINNTNNKTAFTELPVCFE